MSTLVPSSGCFEAHTTSSLNTFRVFFLPNIEQPGTHTRHGQRLKASLMSFPIHWLFTPSSCLFSHMSCKFSLTGTKSRETFKYDLICPMCEASEGNLACFTSSVRNIALRLKLPSTQLISW
ncbi:hypothetical protein CRENBAI_010654 [Crenichthys baileyi]|uniref:Uncharacterized protein n=1 Tax=Crenichthys baileyi TaxID=28760 RepID=A0AAV9RM95_9TELE